MAARVPPHEDPTVLASFKRTFNAYVLSPERMRLKAAQPHRPILTVGKAISSLIGVALIILLAVAKVPWVLDRASSTINL